LRKYEKTVKTYETEEIKQCTCDRCGRECQINKDDSYSKRTLVNIHPMYAGDSNLYRDLCTDCTIDLLDWFKKDEDVEDFIETLNIWEED
jgi:hypothetical protein